MIITLVGGGMGAAETLTLEALEALRDADVVLGAGRLLAGLPAEVTAELIPLALPAAIAERIARDDGWQNVCVLLSGDVGFHSGARKLLELLEEHRPRLVPGLATPQYFAARLRRPWQDFRLVSAHGACPDVLAEVLNHPSVLFLTGGDVTPGVVARTLCEAGLGAVRLTVAENLSAPDERIAAGTAAELADGRPFPPLSVVLVDNDRTFSRPAGPGGLPDADFVRGDVPMTKREVRALALSLLAPRPEDTLYDIGAGTGSVAVELALQARRGRVYAVERDAGALSLLDANRERFGVFNLRPVRGPAPEALAPLPAPDAAFIGGSGGRIAPILEAVLGKNPRARLVVSAITLETLAAAMDAMRDLSVPNLDVLQLAASRTVVRAGRHMLEARNPVFLVQGGGA